MLGVGVGVGVQWNSVCQELDQSAARHYRQVRLLCELPSDQQNNRPADQVRNCPLGAALSFSDIIECMDVIDFRRTTLARMVQFTAALEALH